MISFSAALNRVNLSADPKITLQEGINKYHQKRGEEIIETDQSVRPSKFRLSDFIRG